MFNWLIKLLGCYTGDNMCRMLDELYRLELEIKHLELALEQARKNDTPRDPKTGRFVSKK